MKKSFLSNFVTPSKVSTTIVCFAIGFQASAQASGQVAEFRSDNGIIEKCTSFSEIPGGRYSKSDQQKATEFCQLDFNNNTLALCPKTWSTSPGVMLYKIPSGSSTAGYEQSKCGLKDGHKKAGKLKITMSEADTSATYSKASLLYYHFSRYFDMQIKVPVAVKRTIDAQSLYSRVSSKAKGQGKMNAAAWVRLRNLVMNGNSERTSPDQFENSKEMYGVILRDKGERYGTEINGVRSAWGDAQNFDFQKTAAFTALRAQVPFLEAIEIGIRSARANSKLAVDLAGQPSQIQMISWMRDLIEITLLDYIFSQQDRIGNIDFEWQWIYNENGQIKTLEVDSDLPRRHMAKLLTPPAEIASFRPQLIQRTWLGDNDAGGKVNYGNYTKRTKMLESIRHYNPTTYRQLMRLNHDLSTKGEIYNYILENFKLPSREVQMIVSNTNAAASILKSACQNGLMRFDLNPRKLLTGEQIEEVIDCN